MRSIGFGMLHKNERTEMFPRRYVDMHPECVSVPGVLVDVCQDGSHVGIWVPTLVADKVCTADAPKMFSVSSTSDGPLSDRILTPLYVTLRPSETG
jgi:hypothetical protein